MGIFPRPLNLRDWGRDIVISRPPSAEDFPYNGIWTFTGAQGAGKTLFLVDVLRDLVKDYPKVRIITDINLFGIECEPYRGLDSFKEGNGKHGIIYVLDEIQTLYSNLQSKNVSDANLSIWSQNRKNVRLILGTSQRFSRIAKPIREQVTYNIQCSKRIFGFYPYKIFDGEKYDDDGKYVLEEGDKAPSWQFYVPKWKSFFAYNTKEVVRGFAYDKLDS